MGKEIRVTGISKQSDADIKAQLTEEGGVNVWFDYKEIGQQRHEFTCIPEEWDRLVAWVEWQRRDRGFSKGET